MNCRHCNTVLEHRLVDLGMAPPSNAYLTEVTVRKPELHFPLRVFVCSNCWLIQTEDYNDAEELFSSDYAYFSSTSSSWLAHARSYAEMIIDKIGLDETSLVMEVASNDGYLLQNFMEHQIPCLGIEPTMSTANAARALGIPVETSFFGADYAKKLAVKGQQADLIVGNNVYAHVPDINDFTDGLRIALKAGGTITLEFPHALRLLQELQFDTIYHEHYSYLSLTSVTRLFAKAGLHVFDVEELSTHGGSLRIYAAHADDPRPIEGVVEKLLRREVDQGLQTIETYSSFQNKVEKVKDNLLTFLIEQKRQGKKVAAYGAAAKGNTLLNFAGVKPDLIECVFDAAPSKQGRFMPGSRLPILSPDEIQNVAPDLLIILPWNLMSEIMKVNQQFIDGGGKCVTVVPEIEIH